MSEDTPLYREYRSCIGWPYPEKRDMDHPPVGERIYLKRAVERFPHFVAPAGALGKVTECREDHFEVHLEALNQDVMWTNDQLALVTDDVGVIPAR